MGSTYWHRGVRLRCEACGYGYEPQRGSEWGDSGTAGLCPGCAGHVNHLLREDRLRAMDVDGIYVGESCAKTRRPSAFAVIRQQGREEVVMRAARVDSCDPLTVRWEAVIAALEGVSPAEEADLFIGGYELRVLTEWAPGWTRHGWDGCRARFGRITALIERAWDLLLHRPGVRLCDRDPDPRLPGYERARRRAVEFRAAECA